MTLIRPRLTDHFGVRLPQHELDFAIPFLDEDIPLYVDPFLLWKSPSQQDQALHTVLVNSFNYLNYLVHKGDLARATDVLIQASECNEVGLGLSKTRRGVPLGRKKAEEILSLFRLPQYEHHGFTHFEEAQLYVDRFSKDRVSDVCCSYIKSFLVDYTMQECGDLGIETTDVKVALYDYREHQFRESVAARLPVVPGTGDPILLVPRRWLRFVPWISYDDYFRHHCPQEHVAAEGEKVTVAKVLRFNRENYGVVRDYVAAKERTRDRCANDPLFKQIPISSAMRKMSTVQKLPTGKTENADRKYEDLVAQMLASFLYPQLDFAKVQSRTDGGVLIRDLVFYNNDSVLFLKEIHEDFGSRQLVFEMKNVGAIERDHINQLNRYLCDSLGRFGVLVTRHPLKRAMFKNTVDLWSGQRRCIIVLHDEDLALMAQLFESRQRDPIDVLQKKYVEFRRACPG